MTVRGMDMTDSGVLPKSVMKHCSFCNKVEDRVKKLIFGPEGVCICNECIDLCAGFCTEAEALRAHPRAEIMPTITD